MGLADYTTDVSFVLLINDHSLGSFFNLEKFATTEFYFFLSEDGGLVSSSI